MSSLYFKRALLFILIFVTLMLLSKVQAQVKSQIKSASQNAAQNTIEKDKIIQMLIQNFANVSGQFEQTQKNSKKNILGQFNFSQPNRFIWEYQKPFAQIIQSDGQQLYIYDKDLKQISIKKINNELYTTPIAVFFDAKNWQKNFSYTIKNIQQNTQNNKNITQQVMLIPKNKDSTYVHLIIDINNAQIPQGFAFKDNIGNEGYIRINNLKKKIFKTSDFNFIIPKDVDVIRD